MRLHGNRAPPPPRPAPWPAAAAAAAAALPGRSSPARPPPEGRSGSRPRPTCPTPASRGAAPASARLGARPGTAARRGQSQPGFARQFRQAPPQPSGGRGIPRSSLPRKCPAPGTAAWQNVPPCAHCKSAAGGAGAAPPRGPGRGGSTRRPGHSNCLSGHFGVAQGCVLNGPVPLKSEASRKQRNGSRWRFAPLGQKYPKGAQSLTDKGFEAASEDSEDD